MGIFSGRTDKNKDKNYSGSSYNTLEENKLLVEIETSQMYAEGGKRPEIERDWEDEYKIYIGKQWETSQGIRTEKGKRRNFNSQDNLVLPMIRNMLAPFSQAPSMGVSGTEEMDEEAADALNGLIPFILYRNKFPEQWDKITEQFISYGPAIGYVGFDQHWIGGSGPNKWVGEIRTDFVKRNEFYPDPAIIDLEERLQEASYINIKKRKKLSWFAEKFEKGKYVIEDTLDIPKGQEDEGQEPNQATLIVHYHKGTPHYVPDEWKEIFLEKAQQAESEWGLPYYAKDLRDMANGTLKGVHCAYKTSNVLLDYVPYIYDDGLYPFVFKVLYRDEQQPMGMGEIRNVVKPQIMHNKADEIELGAMLSQGLGGGFYEKGSISDAQREELLDNIAKPNTWNEINNINGLKPKPPVQMPTYITNYKEGKKNVIDTVSGNTAILQGISPGANVPYSTISELGARADSRTRHKSKILELFMIDFVQLITNRIAQFYTEERKYRILGNEQSAKVQKEAYKALREIANMPQGTPPEEQMQAMIELLMFIKQQQEKPKTATFRREMLVHTWDRDIDENGMPMREEFLPDFDVKVKIVDERPTDRNYYTTMATQLFGSAMGVKALWKTLDEGKFPPVEEILEELEEMQQAQMQAQQQAQQTGAAIKQQEKEQDKQASLDKIALQNQSMEKQVAMSAAAKVGSNRGPAYQP